MNMSGKKKKQRISKVYLADDGTVISAKDWKWLQEKRLGTSQSEASGPRVAFGRSLWYNVELDAENFH